MSAVEDAQSAVEDAHIEPFLEEACPLERELSPSLKLGITFDANTQRLLSHTRLFRMRKSKFGNGRW